MWHKRALDIDVHTRGIAGALVLISHCQQASLPQAKHKLETFAAIRINHYWLQQKRLPVSFDLELAVILQDAGLVGVLPGPSFRSVFRSKQVGFCRGLG